MNKQRVFAMTGSLAFLVGAALWITIDLDHPRKGPIRLSDKALQEMNLPVQP